RGSADGAGLVDGEGDEVVIIFWGGRYFARRELTSFYFEVSLSCHRVAVCGLSVDFRLDS
ncbi:MAG TPA: hypothetical protein PKA70_19200, partial [Saprospiraceae bacterium]|nr:hypothetical protein [Saprospiraceae bacterium]